MKNKMALLIDIHENIESYSKIQDVLRNLEKGIKWNEFQLSEEELKSLKATKFSEDTISGIEKIIKGQMRALFFNFFTVLDGVGDPLLRKESEAWLGLKLENKTEENDSEYDEFLHDMFYEAYSKWLEIKSAKS